VLLVCADKQGSATAWNTIRGESGIEPALTCVSLYSRQDDRKDKKGGRKDEHLADQLRRLAPLFDDLVIDTGGRDSVEARSAALVADRLVTPVRTSQFDYLALATTNDILPALRALNPILDACLVINSAPTNARSQEAAKLRQDVAEFDNYRILDAQLCERSAYRAVAEAGACVHELRKQTKGTRTAASEVAALYEEIWSEVTP